MEFGVGFILGVLCVWLSFICFVALTSLSKDRESIAQRDDVVSNREFEEMERQWQELFGYEGKAMLREEDEFEQ